VQTDTSGPDMVDGMEKSEDRVLLKMSDAKKLATIFEAPELALEAERAIVQVGEQLEAKKKQRNEEDPKNTKKDS